MSLTKIIEGHTEDINTVHIANIYESYLTLITSSSDNTIRIQYNFIDITPNYNEVIQYFLYDIYNYNTHIHFNIISKFPRIALLAQQYGTEQFFNTYSFLFIEALKHSKVEFLEEFLSLSYSGLLKAIKGNEGLNSNCVYNNNNYSNINSSSNNNNYIELINNNQKFKKESNLYYNNNNNNNNTTTTNNNNNTSNNNDTIDIEENSSDYFNINRISTHIGDKIINNITDLLKKERIQDTNITTTSILKYVLLTNDYKGINIIINNYCLLYNKIQYNQNIITLLQDTELSYIDTTDLLLLAEIAPLDFQKLICSIQLIPVPDNTIPVGCNYLYYRDKDQQMCLGKAQGSSGSSSGSSGGSSTSSSSSSSSSSLMYSSRKGSSSGNMGSTSSMGSSSSLIRSNKQVHPVSINTTTPTTTTTNTTTSSTSNKQYMYIPLHNIIHISMLHAYTKTCLDLDSIDIFNSTVGNLALSFAWRKIGIHVHLRKMYAYLIYIIISTISTLTFDESNSSRTTIIIAIILLIIQIIFDIYFIKEEFYQFYMNPIEYITDIWNILDIIVIYTNITACILRLIYMNDTLFIDILLCISSITGYFNILYYLRAFESTGPLVSMILRISTDMKYLLIVVLLVALGFSQAFWIISNEDKLLPFGTFENSVLNSFVFMLGGYDPSAFIGTRLYKFALGLSCLYMIIVSILLLNLLIALMGDSYSSVRGKGLAQWRLEQAQIITEMQGSMTEEERCCTAVVSGLLICIVYVCVVYVCMYSVCTYSICIIYIVIVYIVYVYSL